MSQNPGIIYIYIYIYTTFYIRLCRYTSMYIRLYSHTGLRTLAPKAACSSPVWWRDIVVALQQVLRPLLILPLCSFILASYVLRITFLFFSIFFFSHHSIRVSIIVSDSVQPTSERVEYLSARLNYVASLWMI